MFLLIQKSLQTESAEKIHFTFHNVSINTDVIIPDSLLENNFTFHNVSINTRERLLTE